jgi:hypothetical protein
VPTCRGQRLDVCGRFSGLFSPAKRYCYRTSTPALYKQHTKSKTVCMHFSNQNSVHAEPDLKLHGTSIPVVTETRFLGLVFDRKLTFVAHIKYLKDRCLKVLSLLRVVAHKDWGADRRLWRVLTGSKMQHYASVLELSAPHLYPAYTSKLGNCPSACAASNLACNTSSNFAQILQTPSTQLCHQRWLRSFVMRNKTQSQTNVTSPVCWFHKVWRNNQGPKRREAIFRFWRSACLVIAVSLSLPRGSSLERSRFGRRRTLRIARLSQKAQVSGCCFQV